MGFKTSAFKIHLVKIFITDFEQIILYTQIMLVHHTDDVIASY